MVRARNPGAIHPPVVVMIDDAGELAQSPAEAALEAILRRGREVDVRVVVAVEAQTARTMWEGWFKEVRKEGQGLLLTPDPDQDGALLGVQLPRHRAASPPPGRGYCVDRGQIRLVQVALPSSLYDAAA
jgi:S-DNA-T family DNA segregation ATPase FtsK/SpoIIIE